MISAAPGASARFRRHVGDALLTVAAVPITLRAAANRIPRWGPRASFHGNLVRSASQRSLLTQVPEPRSQFQIEISANRLKVYVPEGNIVFYDGPINLPFNKAVVQFSHHCYNPEKGEKLEPGPPAPNTFHWSDVAISPATPFTVLRPQQPTSLHDGRNPVLLLPQPAPQNAFLRFAGLGNFQVSFDGGNSFQPAHLQGADRSPEHFASYWTPVPAGTTQLAIRGQENGSNLSWWVQDVSVWASDVPSSLTAPPRPPSQQPPAAAVAEATPAAQSDSSATRAAALRRPSAADWGWTTDRTGPSCGQPAQGG